MTDQELDELEREAAKRQPDEDFAPDVLRLVAEVKQLRKELRVASQQLSEVSPLGALFEQHELGRQKGLEEAAKVVEGMQRDDQDPDDNAQLRAIAADLRALATREG